MSDFDSFDDFMNHSSRDGGGGGYLKGWKKNGYIDTWMHTKRLPRPTWRHQFPRLIVKEDRDTKVITKNWYMLGAVCHEREDVLKKQYKRDHDGGREVPPETCPMCRLAEVVRTMVDDGALDWTGELFRFEEADMRQPIVLHVGGIYGGYGGELDRDDKAALRDAGIYLTDAWKENTMAKLNYLFCVVDNDNPGAGVQKVFESGLLGDKVKGVLRDVALDVGKEDGDPSKHPYAIRWLHRKDEKKFDNKYHATKMSKLQLTEEIEDLIRSDAPDISRDVAPFDAATMRAVMEQHCLVELPWDEIFAGHEKRAEGITIEEATGGAPPAMKATKKVERTPEVATKPKVPPTTKRKAEPAAAPPPVEEEDPTLVACDDCEAPMKADDPECKKCGKVYVEAAKPAAPPVAVRPPPPKRSATPASVPAAKAAKGAPKGAQPLSDEEDIPF